MGEVFALRKGGVVTLSPDGLSVEGHTVRREPYQAIRAARPGEYGLPSRVYYVTCLTHPFPLDLEFPDQATRDRFLSALLVRLA